MGIKDSKTTKDNNQKIRKCPYCHGTGLYVKQKRPKEKQCKFCKGTGYQDYECPDCWGNGAATSGKYLSGTDGDYACTTCKGQGRLKNPCIWCHGTGKE